MLKILSHEGNANQNIPEIPTKSIRMAKIKTQVTADADKDVEKEEHSSIAAGVASQYKHSGNHFGNSFKKLDKILPEDPAILLLGKYQDDLRTCNKVTCSTMFITALFMRARSWKESISPSERSGCRKCGPFTQRSTRQLLKTVNLWKAIQRPSHLGIHPIYTFQIQTLLWMSTKACWQESDIAVSWEALPVTDKYRSDAHSQPMN